MLTFIIVGGAYFSEKCEGYDERNRQLYNVFAGEIHKCTDKNHGHM